MLVSKPEIKRWNVGDAEVLNYATLNEAVEMHLDDRTFVDDGGAASIREQLRGLGDIEVTGYAQREISPRDLGEAALEYLDEQVLYDLADPDSGSTLWSQETQAAARALGKAMLADFWIWAMVGVTTVKVNALEWVEQNRSNWLE